MENLKSVRHTKQDLFSSIIKFEKILYEDSMEMSAHFSNQRYG